MYKLLIADDEPLEREGLELMIQRLLPNQFAIFHAENGRIAIQQVERDLPDIVFMDIKMPGIHGLEAIEEIRKKHPTIKIVILTAYDYFSYAKEAISLGVNEYILKPAKKEQIISLLEKLIEEMEEEKRTRDKELETKEKVGRLLALSEMKCALFFMVDTVRDEDINTLLQLLNIDYKQGLSIVLELNDVNDNEQNHIIDLVKHFSKEMTNCLCSPFIHNQMAIFLPVESTEDMTDSKAIPFATKLLKYIEQHVNKKVKIGIGTIREGIQGWKQSYKEALAAVELQPYFGRVKHFSEITWTDETKRHIQIRNHSVYQWFTKNEAMVDKQPKSENILDAVRTYIFEHFDEDISLEQVAQFVNLNPYYFSKLFKKLTGQTFSDYVTSIRIEKAKQLMQQGELNIKEISYHVGYHDPNYFSRVFKKVTNMTPKEYRSRIQK
jgi:two-component system, response regulator YesN